MLISSDSGCIYNKLAWLGSSEMRWRKVKWRIEWKIIGFRHQWLERERDTHRGRLFFMVMSQELFNNIHTYFCSQKNPKHQDNSNHQITLNLLQVRKKLCDRMTWVLLLEGLETEYTEEEYATAQHRKPLFYESEEKDQSNLGCSALCMTTGRNWVDEKAQQCLRGHLRMAFVWQWRFSTYSVGTDPYARVLPPVFKKKYTTLQKTSRPKEKSNSPCCVLKGSMKCNCTLIHWKTNFLTKRGWASCLEQSLICAVLEMCPNTACGVQVRKVDMEFCSLFTIKQY